VASEQEIGRLVIKLVADVKDLKLQLAAAQQNTKQFADQAEKTATGFGASIAGLKASYLGAAAAIYAAFKTIQTAVGFLEIGAKAQQTEAAFASLTKSMGVNGDELILQMQEAGATFAEQTDLMVKAQRLLIEGVSPKQIVQLMEASRVAARTMGVDVSEAFDRVSEALIRLQTRGLKAAFSMDQTEVVENYAQSLGTVGNMLDEVGQRQALVREVIRQGIERKSFLGAMTDLTTAENLEKVGSAFGELKEQVGKLIADLVTSSDVMPRLLDLFQMVIDFMQEIKQFQGEIGFVFKAVSEIFRQLLIGIKGVFVGVTAVFAGLYELNYELLSMINVLTLRAFPGLGKAVEDFGKRREKVWESLKKQSLELDRLVKGVPAEKEARKKEEMGGTEISRQDQLNQRKLTDELSKFRLANEEQRIASQNEMVRAGLEARKALEMDAAKKIGQSTTLVELKWQRVFLDEDLRAAKESLAIKEKQELEAARLAGMDQLVVRQKFNTMRLALDEKLRAGLVKNEADYAEYERKVMRDSLATDEQRMALRNKILKSGLDAQKILEVEGAKRNAQDASAIELKWDRILADESLKATQRDLAAKEAVEIESAKDAGKSVLDVQTRFILERQQAEADYQKEIADISARAGERERELLATRQSAAADYNSQLAEISGNYDLVTAAQLRSIEVEKENFIVSQQWAALLPEQQRLYVEMMDARIAKLKETRALEATRDTAQWWAELQGMTGAWLDVKDAEVQCLEIERDILLATAKLNDAQTVLVNQIYARKIAEVDAQASMNWGAMNQIAAQKESLTLNQQLADSYGSMIVQSVNAAGDAIGNFLTNLSSGTMSVGEAFEQLGMDFAKAIQKMLIDIAILIVKMQILKALESTALGAGMEGGGLIQGFQTGGKVSGPSGTDRVPIRATAGEYIHPVGAVRYYGIQAMEAIRRKAVPREMFAGLAGASRLTPSLAMAAGGQVPSINTSGAEGSKIDLTMVNVTDPRDLDKYLSSSAGQNAVLNVISSRADTVKKVLR
jgi:hypothetical protein